MTKPNYPWEKAEKERDAALAALAALRAWTDDPKRLKVCATCLVVEDSRDGAVWHRPECGVSRIVPTVYLALDAAGLPPQADIAAENAKLKERNKRLDEALWQLRVDCNRLCDRNLGGTYEDDARLSIKKADEALRS